MSIINLGRKKGNKTTIVTETVHVPLFTNPILSVIINQTKISITIILMFLVKFKKRKINWKARTLSLILISSVYQCKEANGRL